MAERIWSEKDLYRQANGRLPVLRHAEEVGGNVAAAGSRRIGRLQPAGWEHIWEQNSAKQVTSGVLRDIAETAKRI